MPRTLLSVVVAVVGLLLALGVVAGLHGYLVERLLVAPGWLASTTSAAGLTGIAAAVGLMTAAMLAERLVSPPWLRLVTWPGYLWMGLALLLTVGLALSDLVMWPLGLLADVAAARVRALAVVGVALGATVLGVWSALRPALRRVRLEVAGWPRSLDGFRIAQLSDLHLGPILGRRWAERVVERTLALEADLVAVTGDLIDGFVPRVGPETAPLSRLWAPHGVYVITGNHEMFCGPRRWTQHYASVLGLRVLANERVRIPAHAPPGEGFTLAGTHDRSGRHFGCGEDLAAVTDGHDAERDGPLVLLAHDPLTFREASARGVDVQLSGHTHGGQIWPLHVFVRLVVPFVAGHHRRGASQLYVSRGTGFWGPPLRLLAPPEITLVEVRAAR